MKKKTQPKKIKVADLALKSFVTVTNPRKIGGEGVIVDRNSSALGRGC